MLSLGLITRIHVLTAIRDHDQLGAVEFRQSLAFTDAGDEVLVERGKRYDARALLAYAHGKATGDFAGPEEVSLNSLQVLTDLGFSVTFRSELDRQKMAPTKAPRAARSSTPRATTTRVTKPEPVVRLCPSCYTQLSMAGTCDYCE